MSHVEASATVTVARSSKFRRSRPAADAPGCKMSLLAARAVSGWGAAVEPELPRRR